MSSADFVSPMFITEHLNNIIKDSNIHIMACIDEPQENGSHNTAIITIGGKGSVKGAEVFGMWELLTAKTIEEICKQKPDHSDMVKAIFFKRFLSALSDPEEDREVKAACDDSH